MPWPADDLSTDDLDSQNDTPPRAEFLKLVQRVKAIIAGRGTADGIASLGAGGKVPDAQLARALANGVASLDGTTKVPNAQLHRGEANGVAGLDGTTKVPNAQLHRGEANGVASLDGTTKVPDTQLGRGAANGVAGLDGNGRVPAAQLPPAVPARTLLRSTTEDDWTNGSNAVEVPVAGIDDHAYITVSTTLLRNEGNYAYRTITIQRGEIPEDTTPAGNDAAPGCVFVISGATFRNILIGRNSAGTALYFQPNGNVTGRVADIWGGSF